MQHLSSTDSTVAHKTNPLLPVVSTCLLQLNYLSYNDEANSTTNST